MFPTRVIVVSLSCFFGNFHLVRSIQNVEPVPFSTLATCSESYVNVDKCDQFFSIDSLKNYQSDKYRLHLKFYVMASNDVNIVLWSSKDDSKVEYTAVIGGFSNTQSWFRTIETVGMKSDRKGILSPLWPTPIVLQQTHCGELRVSIPFVAEPLITVDADELDVKLVCFYSMKNPSRWFYNCDEDEDMVIENRMHCTQKDPNPFIFDVRSSSRL